MSEDIKETDQDFTGSSLYSEDLAPVPISKRSWTMWDMAAIWVGMAVCIPTYLLASYMMRSGLSWLEALLIILLGNIIITVPMILNGHAGVKYGLPFPVLGRASFGIRGIHIAAVVRGIVACGWFGIQTWIGGLAFYAIWNALMGSETSVGLDVGKFMGFGLFWLLNVFFIWQGTESIKWLEKFAAPILIGIGLLLIFWGAQTAGGFSIVLKQSDQLARAGAVISKGQDDTYYLNLNAIKDKSGKNKASDYKIYYEIDGEEKETEWTKLQEGENKIAIIAIDESINIDKILNNTNSISLRLKNSRDGKNIHSSIVAAVIQEEENGGILSRVWTYLLWLTAMVGFWATMAISIADITRYTSSQRNQIVGQFIGLPGTMALFSFVGIFVTCAALINFQDILIAGDAPWDPVSLLAKFENPIVVIIAQIFMIIATLSTNIAANVIAPANTFSNLAPTKISFRAGGIIAAVIGIIIMPWWLLDEISGLLIFVSGFLGPVLGILICDYYIIRGKEYNLASFFDVNGEFCYKSGFNLSAMYAFAIGIALALIGLFVSALSFLYTLSWFTGFIAAFIVYYILMKNNNKSISN